MGIWRLDRPTGCTSTGTSFTGSAVSGSLDDILELDCAQFSADPHDTVVVHTVGNVSQELHDGTGAYACANITRGSCELSGPAPYRVLTYGSNPVGYQFRVVSLTRQVGCYTVPATTFGHAPAGSFTLADAADLACFRSDRANVGGQVLLRTARAATDPPASVTMYPPSGATQCTGTAEIDRCAGGPAGRYLFLVGAAAATSGSFGWYDLSTDDGCRAMTSTAFGAAPTRGSIADRGAVDCMTVPVVPTDSVRLAFAPPAAALDLHAWMPLGDRVAAPPCEAGGVDPVDCKIRATAPATTHAYVWTANTSGADAGTYYLHAWRLNAPMGCRDIGSLKDGFGPLVRTLRDSNDEFCYQGTALAGGVLDVTTANDDVPTDIPQMQFLRPGGRRDCTVQGSGTCSLQVSQTYSLLVLRGSGVPDFTGRYRVSGDCTNDTCGP